MGEKVCAIIGDDELYLRRLMNAMNACGEFCYRTMIYTDVAALNRYLENHGMDVLIADGNIDTANINTQRAGCFIQLCEEEQEPEGCIYKYQAAGQVIRKISCMAGPVMGGGTAKLIGVYSPVCGCGKTCFSLVLAKLYGQSKKTLYINLEQFSGLLAELPPTDKDMSDVAYMYRLGEQEALKCLDKAIVCREAFDYIAPVECASDIEFITTSQWLDMIRFIGDGRGYDIVVIDVGNAIKEPWQFTQACNTIYMPQRKDSLSQNKVRAFEKYLIEMGKEQLLERVVPFVVEPEEIDIGSSLLDALENTMLWQKAGRILNGQG